MVKKQNIYILSKRLSERHNFEIIATQKLRQARYNSGKSAKNKNIDEFSQINKI